MAIFLGLCVALGFGSGDFVGGLASRRAPTLAVLAAVQATAVAIALTLVLLTDAEVTGRDLGFGALAGTGAVVGLGLLYHGLATGRMGIVAPITAVIASSIPVAWGISTGEEPSALSLVGVACAVGAGGLIARERDLPADGGRVGRDVVLALGAGVAFGLSFVAYAETGDDSGFWPLLAARGTALPLALVAVAVTRTSLRLPRRELRFAVGAGAFDVSATALLLVAVREGLASLVAPVAALGPAFTVALAWLVLSEPIAKWQRAGLVLALVGLVLIAAG
ncbi:MAG TPA: DMT family transporter [Acidimicrobiia bacterium]|nr:DMT family transporter [Acidimicrobiia bacterium]